MNVKSWVRRGFGRRMMANIWWSLPLTLIVFFAARKLAARV
ncbi:hypothetical protein ACLB1S_20025 [Escherichia coli]